MPVDDIQGKGPKSILDYTLWPCFCAQINDGPPLMAWYITGHGKNVPCHYYHLEKFIALLVGVHDASRFHTLCDSPGVVLACQMYTYF